LRLLDCRVLDDFLNFIRFRTLLKSLFLAFFIENLNKKMRKELKLKLNCGWTGTK
jgi:hypothetical protein